MRPIIYILSVMLLIISNSTVTEGAEGGYTLTLEECREMAIKSSHLLTSSREQQLISEDMLAAYRSNQLPNFSLNGVYAYSPISFSEVIAGGYLPTFVPDATGALVPNVASVTASGETIFNSYAYMPDMEFKVEVGSVYSVGVMAMQPIYMGGKINSAIKLARLGVDISKLNMRRSEAEILEQTDIAFYNMVRVEEMLLAAAKYESVVAEFYRQMERGVESGMKSRNDLLKVGVRLSEAKLLRQKAMNGLRLAKMNLCYTIGLPLTTTDIALREEARVSTAVDDQDLDITRRPEYEMLERQIEAKGLEVNISRSEFMPSLSAIASYSYLNGGTFNGSPMFNSANISAGVIANVPLFHWGEGRRKVSAKRREVAIAESEAESMTKLMSLELLQAINLYNESILEVELTEQALEQAEENMRVSRMQYEAGMETVADYLESQALWQSSMSDLCSARSALRVAYTKYKKCRGELTSN